MVEGAGFDGPGPVTASFGVAAYRDGDSPETLLERERGAVSGQGRRQKPGRDLGLTRRTRPPVRRPPRGRETYAADSDTMTGGGIGVLASAGA